MATLVKVTKVEEGYRIHEEGGMFFPQRLSKADNTWVYYTDMQYGRRFNVSFKTKQGVLNFLHLEWFKDIHYTVQDAHLASGNVSDVLLKALGIKRKRVA